VLLSSRSDHRKEESESYLRKALEKELNCEVALKMRSFYKLKGDKFQQEYWDNLYKKLEKDNIHADTLIPDVFK
jgi:hypothetical protein